MREQTVSPGRRRLYTALKLAALALVVVLCVLVIRPALTSPSSFRTSRDYLDGKKQNAMMISLGTASASFIVSMIPDDTGTPIASELARLSSYLLFVLSAILLERFLLSALGFFATCVIMPIACLCGAFAALSKGENRQKFRQYAIRFLVLAVCLVQIIPVACVSGQAIENANRASIEAAIEDAQEANEIVESIPEEQRDKNIFDKVADFFSGIWDSASDAYEWAKSVLSSFLSSVSVIIVTTVAIPVMILVFYIWIVRILTRKDFTGALITMVSGWFGKNGDGSENDENGGSGAALPPAGEDSPV